MQNEIKQFLNEVHNAGEYYEVFKELSQRDALCKYAWDGGFFESPASTRFHGAWKIGLAQHSLGVLYYALKLVDAFDLMDKNDNHKQQMIIAALFHDLCKMGAYVEGKRWSKDENGKWIEVPTYEWNKQYVAIGHGSESLRRIEKFYVFLDEAWAQAVAWHMGGADDKDTRSYMSTAEKFPEVLLLHTADMMESTCSIRNDQGFRANRVEMHNKENKDG